MNPPLIWVTRTEPQASVTAQALRARGFEVINDPLLEVEPLSPDIDVARFAHIIATSINGLKAFTRQYATRHQTVWAVGDATAREAREAGFHTVHSASGDVEDLIRLLKAETPQGPLLYPQPETPARDLSTALSGFDLHPVLFYRTVVRDAPDARAQMAAITHILLYSPRGAQACAPYLSGVTARVLCISEATAQRLREHLNFTGNLPSAGLNIEVAASPDEEALFARL
ncbi:MAG: uroporphyrinogen-III synthase [Asticcacaulis sp.]|uniref:uroporphyrinogen-III synthase n=1 Tax=Asticcacaulis sp. TaxID=1872648 RepID=UPI0025C6C284|nr:uroporphyrinogen-III synthase [Asticcacaulis sp.]MCA1936989.1 uroporphyrinogen-III synthase [Asticcacaulis sp.]